MDIENYKVYIKTDGENKIIAINSSAFLSDVEGWIQIDEGINDHHHHAQNNYLEKGLIGENYCYNYKFIDGVVSERTVEEKQEEINSRAEPLPSVTDILGRRVVELELENLELKQQNNVLGEQLVSMELANLELHQQNTVLGEQVVNMDLRLLALEGSASL